MFQASMISNPYCIESEYRCKEIFRSHSPDFTSSTPENSLVRPKEYGVAVTKLFFAGSLRSSCLPNKNDSLSSLFSFVYRDKNIAREQESILR